MRDANNTANTRPFIQDVFTRATAIVNSRQVYVTDEVTLTETAGKAIYTFETELGGVSEITDVRLGQESLNHVDPWRNLWKLSPTWLTDMADVPLAWATIGRDRAAIYPSPVSDIPITFVGVRGSFQALAETEETGLRDEDADIVKELTVALILLRQRDLDMIRPTMSRVAAKMNIQAEEVMDLMRIG